MYTEGYIVKVEVKAESKNITSFRIDSASPYKLQDGDSVGILALDVNHPFPKESTSPIEAKVYQSKTLVLTSQREFVDIPSLIALKTSHSKIGVVFDAENNVSEITVL